MGTFPGGLALTDPGQSAESQTGLVYSCPVQPGVCEGVQGNTSITDQDIDANRSTNTDQELPTNGPVIEGRLFDQARKNFVCLLLQLWYNGLGQRQALDHPLSGCTCNQVCIVASRTKYNRYDQSCK